MSAFTYSIKNFGYRFGMRVFMPDLAQQMEQEGMLDLPKEGETPKVEYMKVEDNGADLTIFAFSGLDVMFAGLARYEFQKVLRDLNLKANFVFLRDVHRMGFQLTPDGQPGGPAFYIAEIQRTMAELGSTRNIAIGSSIGGSVAFSYGCTAGMDELVLFGAALNLDGFCAPGMVRKCLFDVRQLFREPRAYAELLIVTLAAGWAKKSLSEKVGVENLSMPLDAYAKAVKKPAITVMYGATAWPDVGQAAVIQDYPRTRLVPLPTGRHNTPAFLKARGELSKYIADAIANVPA